MKIDYCGFNTVEELIADHIGLKTSIKLWEKRVDELIYTISYSNVRIEKDMGTYDENIKGYITDSLSGLSDEMMSINM